MLFNLLWKYGFSSIKKPTRKAKKPQRIRPCSTGLNFEQLEIRALLSATSDTIELGWITPLAGQAFTMNAEINGTLISGTPRTGTLTLSEGGNTLANLNLGNAGPVVRAFMR